MEPQLKTLFFLLGICAGLSVPLVLWFIDSPEELVIALGIGTFEQLGMTVWLFTAAIVVAYCCYTINGVPLIRKKLLTFDLLKCVGIVSAVITGVVEEMFFRRILMDALYEAQYSSTAQIVVSALAFGLVHIAWIANSGERKAIVPIVIATTILGATLACLYLFAQRNVFPCIVAHTVINLVIEPWLLLASISGFQIQKDDSQAAL